MIKISQIVAEMTYAGTLFAFGVAIGALGVGSMMLRGRDVKAREIANNLRQASQALREESQRYPEG